LGISLAGVENHALVDVENHVTLCVKKFGEENRELCYMVNSWMDGPARDLGQASRFVRHDVNRTPLEASRIYRNSSQRNLVIAIVLQHLQLDGLITPTQEREWTEGQALKNIEILKKRKKFGFTVIALMLTFALAIPTLYILFDTTFKDMTMPVFPSLVALYLVFVFYIILKRE
jgi:hypothetical protein